MEDFWTSLFEILGSSFSWRDFKRIEKRKEKMIFFGCLVRVTLEKKIGGAQVFFPWAHQNSISPNWGENTEGKQGALLLSVLDKTITSTATSTFIFWTYLLSFLFCFCFFFQCCLTCFFFFFFFFFGCSSSHVFLFSPILDSWIFFCYFFKRKIKCPFIHNFFKIKI